MPGPPGRHNRGNRRGGNTSAHTSASVGREVAMNFAADSKVLAVFQDAAKKLNERQDKHERLIKLSRDITIESKRIIFLLHSLVTKETSASIITEATERIQKLLNEPIKSIGLELEHSPAHLHSKAVTAGFQEYVEARTLLALVSEKRVITYHQVQAEFECSITEGDIQRALVTIIPQIDYMLGIADLTGELMRKAINSISSGDTEECFRACDVIRHLYTGYISVAGCRHLIRKLQVTRANLNKVEMAVYTLRIRGGERPPTLLLPAAPAGADAEYPAQPSAPEDEGYC